MSFLNLSLAALLSVILCACGSDGDMNSAESMLEIGRHDEGVFQAFSDQDTIAIHHGIQGGYHIVCALRGRFQLPTRGAKVTLRLTREPDATSISLTRSMRNIDPSDVGDSFILEDLIVFLPPDDAVTGTEVDLVAEIDDGTSLHAGGVHLRFSEIVDDWGAARSVDPGATDVKMSSLVGQKSLGGEKSAVYRANLDTRRLSM